MQRIVDIVVAEGQSLQSSLPANLKKRVRKRLGDEVYRFEEAAWDDARRLVEAARKAGISTSVEAQFSSEDEPLEDARVYKLFLNDTCEDTKLENRGLIREERCPKCGTDYEVLDDKAKPKLSVKRNDLPPLFRPYGDGHVLIRDDFAATLQKEKVLTGARLISVESPIACSVLTGATDIGLEVWDGEVGTCSKCGRKTEEIAQFFPLFKPPAKKCSIYYSSDHLPVVPIVTGRLARALGKHDPKAIDCWYCGWYPQELETARVPSF